MRGFFTGVSMRRLRSGSGAKSAILSHGSICEVRPSHGFGVSSVGNPKEIGLIGIGPGPPSKRAKMLERCAECRTRTRVLLQELTLDAPQPRYSRTARSAKRDPHAVLGCRVPEAERK